MGSGLCTLHARCEAPRVWCLLTALLQSCEEVRPQRPNPQAPGVCKAVLFRSGQFRPELILPLQQIKGQQEAPQPAGVPLLSPRSGLP